MQVSVACAAQANGQHQHEDTGSAPTTFLDQSAGKFRRRALLWWPNGAPRSALIVKKRNDADAADMLYRIAEWCGHTAFPMLFTLQPIFDTHLHTSRDPSYLSIQRTERHAV
jgi:hypothetical protein